ncbi:hypothetical protein BJF93_23205 [Xaviernesmea oryzae]|uniref:Uncharacterized protein n=2 Tax=Xaviernesmea oryzae TaxID=464029 RepID=A0A1Q9AU82_9HYPH|nr:hypothetical protein BJF93_23205 [Xaviernesmea oryzae]
MELIERAAAILDAAGDWISALRLRGTGALIRDDQSSANHERLQSPLMLMRLALVSLEQVGEGVSAAACQLQSAIDSARGRTSAHGEEVNVEILNGLLRSPLR